MPADARTAAHTPAQPPAQPGTRRDTPLDLDAAIARWPSEAATGSVATDRLELRPYTEGQRDAMIELLRTNRDRLRPIIPINNDGETDDAWFDRQLALAERGRTIGDAWRRTVWLIGSDQPVPIGAIHLNSIARGLEAEADVCTWIDHAHSGRGLASEALAATLAVAFALPPRGLGLTAIHGGVQPGNGTSRRLIEGRGFRLDPGKQTHLLINGRWVLHDYYIATPPITG